LRVQRFRLAWLLIVLVLLLPGHTRAAPHRLIGKEAPYFRVEAGDGKILDATMIRGKVIVLFYETKDILPKSRPLKKALDFFYREQIKEINDQILILPVINTTSAIWPLTGFWKNAMIERSQKVGMTVYGDWNGKMSAAYRMKEDDTNLVIMDKNGIIRFFQSGVIGPEKAGVITSLLLKIVKENYGHQAAKSL
jgi:hypothetical protein